MRNLDLGPETRRLIEEYKRQAYDKEMAAALAGNMVKLLERWMEVSWCWVDAAPARICGGPHVRVKYQHDRMGQDPRPTEIIEPADHIGETFPDVPYTIIRS